MKSTRRLGGLLLAPLFIRGGWLAFKDPGARAKRAERLGIPEPELMTQVNGMTMVVAGSALGLGIFPRLAALVLAGTLVPTTLAGHPFWEEEDPGVRAQQELHFLKNLAVLGGLMWVFTARSK